VKARVDDRPEESEPDGVDVAEHGRSADGETISLDRRLYMQLHAYGGARDTPALIAALEGEGVAGTLYEDVNDPTGVALLTLSESPETFVSQYRAFLQSAVCRARAEAGVHDARRMRSATSMTSRRRSSSAHAGASSTQRTPGRSGIRCAEPVRSSSCRGASRT
jgi:hypothetical protein